MGINRSKIRTANKTAVNRFMSFVTFTETPISHQSEIVTVYQYVCYGTPGALRFSCGPGTFTHNGRYVSFLCQAPSLVDVPGPLRASTNDATDCSVVPGT